MPSSQKPRRPELVGLTVGLAGMLNPLNGTLLNTVFVAIAATFELTFAEASYLLPVYLAFTTAFQPLAGAFGDRVGRRRALLVGVVGFMAVSAAAAFAPTFGALVACRAGQAVCSAIIMPNCAAIVRDALPEHEHGKAMGLMGAMIGVAAGIGFPLGGALSDALGWRALFWVNLPFGLLALAGIVRALPDVPPRPVELTAVSLVASPMLPLIVGLELVEHDGSALFGRALVSGSAVALLAAIGAVVMHGPTRKEARALANTTTLLSLAIVSLQGAVMYGAFLVLPTWIAQVLGIAPAGAGAYMALVILAMVVAGPFAGIAADRIGARIPTVLGLLVMDAAFFVLTRGTAGSRAALLFGLVAFGAGLSFTLAPLQRATLQASPERSTGLAMGLLSSARYVGGIVGAATVAAWLGESSTIAVASGSAALEALTLGAGLPALLLAAMVPASTKAARAG